MKFRNYITILFFMPVTLVFGQANSADSLSLEGAIEEMIQNYPALKKAGIDLLAMDAKIGLTKTSYLPDVNFNTSYSRVGPTTSITMPINGTSRTFSLFPENVYNATLSINENIYDFGRTAKNLELDQKNKELVALTGDQIKQRLSFSVTACYYSISFLEEAIRIKNSQLKNLNDHLSFVQKKADTGSATRFDIVTTKVRISSVESQITDLKSALQIQTVQLNSLLGKPVNNIFVLKKVMLEPEIVPSTDSLLDLAFMHRPEMQIAMQKEEITKSKLEVVKVQNNPSFSFFASGGFKNGYLNEYLQDVGKLNYAVGVGLKVPVFDANRSKFAKIQIGKELENNQQDTELTKRNITTEVIENKVNVDAALKKVNQTELQLQQAEQAYELAEVSYQAGSITNLDLLDSYTSLAESRLQVFKSKIDYKLNLQKLKISIGLPVF